MTNKPEPSQLVTYWTDEINQARKREAKYRKTGQDILKIYGAEEEDVVPFNILFSNTETLLPALYSAQPRPVVQRRFKDDDPIGKLAADAGRRMLEHLLDTNRDGYESFGEAMESAVLDSLLPGRGMVALHYEADFRPIAEPELPQADEAPAEPQLPAEEAYNEAICPNSLAWDRVYLGYAKKWVDVPWVAYEFFLTKEEVAKLLGEDAQARTLAAKLRYQKPGGKADDQDREGDEKQGQRKVTQIYQIWDKAGGKKIRYLAPSHTEGLLKVEDDPLGLTGFFNMPKPMQFIRKSSSLMPTAPYKLYKNQAQELNKLTQRINRTIDALRARGVYDGALGDQLSKLMEKDDNTLIPADVASGLATEKGFQNAIWFMPLEVVMSVLAQLYQAREACKRVIYEITGISDILRGSTQASETATAQQIKNQWGTLRLKRMQADVARYARDLLRMKLELAATKFSEQTWASITGLPFLLQPQLQQLQMQAQALTSMGQPVPQELQAQMAQPTWAQILDLLRNDAQRSYRIDIETNSTVEPEAAEDQKGITEMMTAMGQTLNGLGPLVAKGVMPFQIAQSMLLFIVRRFRFGTDIEGYIQGMQAPPPPDADQGKQLEMQQKEQEMQNQQAQQRMQLEVKQAQMELEAKQMQAEMELQKREMQLQMREMEVQMKEQQFGLQQEYAKQSLDMHQQRVNEELGTKQKVADLENKKYKTENVVNQKADTALGQGVKAMQGLVQQLVHAVAQQSQQNQQMVQELVGTLSRPRMKRAIRGQDGRIEAVEEHVA